MQRRKVFQEVTECAGSVGIRCRCSRIIDRNPRKASDWCISCAEENLSITVPGSDELGTSAGRIAVEFAEVDNLAESGGISPDVGEVRHVSCSDISDFSG